MRVRQQQDIIGAELSRLANDEYLEDIMQSIREEEVCEDETCLYVSSPNRTQDKSLPDVSRIDKQPEIQWHMRPYLVDFLIEAHAELGLLPETLFRTVNLLDRYCSQRIVYKKNYQLLGCSALLIAAKYAEKKCRVPSVYQLYNMCDGQYDTGMFGQMEIHILKSLDWIVGNSTADFLARLTAVVEGEDEEVADMAVYLCEIALYHREFVSAKPSVMAQSALTHARAVLGRAEVSDGCRDKIKNGELSFRSDYLRQPRPTVVRKYSTSRLSKVSRKLTQFMAEQNDLSHPPTNPDKLDREPTNKDMTNISSTPERRDIIGQFHNFPTPPVTPGRNHSIV
jgi:hypothetical protein